MGFLCLVGCAKKSVTKVDDKLVDPKLRNDSIQTDTIHIKAKRKPGAKIKPSDIKVFGDIKSLDSLKLLRIETRNKRTTADSGSFVIEDQLIIKKIMNEWVYGQEDPMLLCGYDHYYYLMRNEEELQKVKVNTHCEQVCSTSGCFEFIPLDSMYNKSRIPLNLVKDTLSSWDIYQIKLKDIKNDSQVKYIYFLNTAQYSYQTYIQVYTKEFGVIGTTKNELEEFLNTKLGRGSYLIEFSGYGGGSKGDHIGYSIHSEIPVSEIVRSYPNLKRFFESSEKKKILKYLTTQF